MATRHDKIGDYSDCDEHKWHGFGVDTCPYCDLQTERAARVAAEREAIRQERLRTEAVEACLMAQDQRDALRTQNAALVAALGQAMRVLQNVFPFIEVGHRFEARDLLNAKADLPTRAAAVMVQVEEALSVVLDHNFTDTQIEVKARAALAALRSLTKGADA